MDDRQYLTFTLAGEQYGVEITKVKEIMGLEPIRKIPSTPEFIKGVLNLRGEVVPVIDLRERFGFDSTPYTNRTIVIIINLHDHVMGIVADAVSDVLDVKGYDIKSPPSLGASISLDYIRGMYMVNGAMIMLLNVDRLLDVETFVDLTKIG